MIEYKSFQAEIKAYSEADLTVDHFITVQIEDRSGDLLYIDGMRLDAGRPVVLHSHGMNPQVGAEPVAKPLWIRPGTFKGYKGIEARTKFYPDELGQRLWRKNVEGYFPSWSVGFIVDEYRDKEGGRGRDILKWTLVEYSLVAVPSNPYAQTPEIKNLSFAFTKDWSGCDCGKALCQSGDGRSFQCRHVPIKVTVPDELINRLIHQGVKDEFDRLRGKVS